MNPNRDFQDIHPADLGLRATPPPVKDTFTEEVLGQVRTLRKRRYQRKALAMQFCLMLLVAGGLWVQNRNQFEVFAVNDTSLEAVRAGTQWLVETQGDNGAWAAENWGGHARFNSGVTALATLALLHAPDGDVREPINRAVAHLETQLSPATPLHVEGPALYNHLLTLKALLEVQERYPDAQRAELLRNSLAAILRQQQVDGGWGYEMDTPMHYGSADITRANSAVTWWVCDLLHHGRRLGVPGAPQALDRGLAWMDQCLLRDDGPHYHPDAPPATPDSALWWMARLREGHPAADLLDMNRADAYRDLFRKRATQGHQVATHVPNGQTPAGAWTTPNDRWWSAGGQVYTTATTILMVAPSS